MSEQDPSSDLEVEVQFLTIICCKHIFVCYPKVLEMDESGNELVQVFEGLGHSRPMNFLGRCLLRDGDGNQGKIKN